MTNSCTFKTPAGPAALFNTGSELLVSFGGFGNLNLQSVSKEVRTAALDAGRRKGWVQPIDTGSETMTQRDQAAAQGADFDEDGKPLWEA